MGVFETEILKLTTKSPIHIGSHIQRITRFEFLVSSNKVYPIDDKKLALLLKRLNLIADYCGEIERYGGRFDLGDFFKRRAITLSESELLNLSSGREIYSLRDCSKVQEYKPLIRDGFGEPFIPGSSIKGVFRTAILYHLLKELKIKNPKRFEEEIELFIERKIKDDSQGKHKKSFFTEVESRFLRSFNLSVKGDASNRDWLRMLKISDAYAEEKIKTVLVPVNILKREGLWTYKEESPGIRTTLWAECIPAGVSLSFQVSWDRGLMNEFMKENKNIKMPENLTEVFKLVNAWAKDIVEFERGFFSSHSLRHWYERNPVNFRVGAGSGMISTTIIMLLKEPLRTKVRDYSGGFNPNPTAPKSRKVYERDEGVFPLGWCLLGK
ncbi:MAG: type III-A CRISPR-associated RAMP protein Csm5 [Thermodesulfovibrio sp.]|nr:type III-A CRISPR-associated RAMP protein Csm5 [Thermodesulfovibrio sp.]MDW7998784.1 type III-A CRISPR-associated RAMP protein Csm5 [Thermodesulfovibrio sp.]